MTSSKLYAAADAKFNAYPDNKLTNAMVSKQPMNATYTTFLRSENLQPVLHPLQSDPHPPFWELELASQELSVMQIDVVIWEIEGVVSVTKILRGLKRLVKNQTRGPR